jgi:hypothetical protein
MTLNGFGVQLHQKALEIHATTEDFALRKHDLLQAMLAVNDLFYLSVPMVANLFYEDVVAWLDLCEIRYTPGVKFTGRSGYDHHFDFVPWRLEPSTHCGIMTSTLSSGADVKRSVKSWPHERCGWA